MGVWVRGLVLAMGVLAGCVSDADFPETERDYIAVSEYHPYGGLFSVSGEWRIYTNDRLYAKRQTRNGNVIRRETIVDLFDLARKIVSDQVLLELQQLERAYRESCKPYPSPENPSITVQPLCYALADATSYRVNASIEGQRFRFNISEDQIYSEYGERLFSIYNALEKILR